MAMQVDGYDMEDYSFDNLVLDVKNVHIATNSKAKSTINQMLTIRNWAIGYYIVEYEQHGQNRAEYWSNLLTEMAKRLDIKGLDRTSLNLCRLFYVKYPKICETVSHKLKSISELRGLPDFTMKLLSEVDSTVRDDICETVSTKFETDPEVLITRLSFSHIREIMKKEDPFERFFYEKDAYPQHLDIGIRVKLKDLEL